MEFVRVGKKLRLVTAAVQAEKRPAATGPPVGRFERMHERGAYVTVLDWHHSFCAKPAKDANDAKQNRMK